MAKLQSSGNAPIVFCVWCCAFMAIKSAQEWERIGAQFGLQSAFVPLAILVAQGVETRAVVVLGQVGEFVADDRAAQMFGHKHQGCAQGDFAPCRSCDK